jgi:hypothetical protein
MFFSTKVITPLVIYYRDQVSANAMYEEIKDAACMQEYMEFLDESTLSMIFASPVMFGN